MKKSIPIDATTTQLKDSIPGQFPILAQ